MFRDLNERILKKLHGQEKKIRGTKIIPHNTEIEEARTELEKIFSGHGRVNPEYAQKTLIAYEYAKQHCHYLTGESMLDDIKSGKSIVFNNYF